MIEPRDLVRSGLKRWQQCIRLSRFTAITLSQAELGKLFPGSFQAVVNGAVMVKITARGNGTLIGQMTGQEDRGRWSVKSGKLCIVWSTWLNGKASCSRVIADDGWYRGNGVKFRKI